MAVVLLSELTGLSFFRGIWRSKVFSETKFTVKCHFAVGFRKNYLLGLKRALKVYKDGHEECRWPIFGQSEDDVKFCLSDVIDSCPEFGTKSFCPEYNVNVPALFCCHSPNDSQRVKFTVTREVVAIFSRDIVM